MLPDAAFRRTLGCLTNEAPAILGRALRTGGSYADLFYEHTIHHRITWRQVTAGQTLPSPDRTARRQVMEGAAVRVLGPHLMGFVATDNTAPAALWAAASEAGEQLAVRTSSSRSVPLLTVSQHITLPDDAPDRIRPTEKQALVQAAAEAAWALDARLQRVEVFYHDRVRRVAVATSAGALHAQATMLAGLCVQVTLATDAGPVTAHAVAGGCGGFGLFFEQPAEAVAREAVARAARRVQAPSGPTGAMPVVVGSGWGGVWLHEAVGHMLEADTVTAGASLLGAQIGHAVAGDAITLVDDATQAAGRGTYVFDDEAIPAARTVLIENGILRGILTDSRHARALALPSTGNGRRQDYRHLPLPRMSNLVLEPGPIDPKDLIGDVQDGLYVEAVGQGIVQPGGAFAFDVLDGRRIENGKLTAPVRDVRIVGTGLDTLRAIAGVGNDLHLDTARGLCKKAGQVIPVSVGMPTVLLHTMQVERAS